MGRHGEAVQTVADRDRGEQGPRARIHHVDMVILHIRHVEIAVRLIHAGQARLPNQVRHVPHHSPRARVQHHPRRQEAPQVVGQHNAGQRLRWRHGSVDW